jgi:4a-hydroxytetrahydrobiopterin dehydratase
MVNVESSVCLIDKACVPCMGGIPPLDSAAANKLLAEVGHGWKINEAGHLFKEYKFDDFMGSLAFANKIAELAEAEAHHPDITIAWGKCSIEIWTHKIDGLAESDFILAAKIASLTK